MRYVAQKGFTLLEILIAISIFAVIAATVYGSLNAVISKNNAIKGGTAAFEMAKNCLNRISMDLQAMYVDQYPEYKPPDFDDDPDPYGFFGESAYVGSEQFSNLQFASTEHLPISSGNPDDETVPAGLAQIRYHVTQHSENADVYVLRRGDIAFPYDTDNYPDEERADPVICEHIQELKFTYYDEEGNIYETWNSDSDDIDYATPRAVDVYLKIKTDQDINPFFTRVYLPVYRESLQSVEE